MSPIKRRTLCQNVSFYFRTLSLFSFLSLSCWCFSKVYYRAQDLRSPYIQDDGIPTMTTIFEDVVADTMFHMHETMSPYSTRLAAYNDDLLLPMTESDRSMSVVLPVQADSVSSMTSTLLYLLQNPLQTTEVILVAPSALHATIRSILRNILTTTESHVDFDISIFAWSAELNDEALAVLDVASQVVSEKILFLDSSGFVHLRPDTIRHITDPPSLDLPAGPRAYDFSGNDFVCFSPAQSQIRGFLIPPLVIPTSLISDVEDLQREHTYGTWAALAESVSSSEFDETTGIVVGLVAAGSSFCSSEHAHSLSNATLPFLTAEHSSSRMPVNETDSKPVQDGTFAFVFPLYENLVHLLPIVCRIRKQGHNVHALISTPVPGEYVLPSCTLDVATISESSSMDDMGTALSEWILTLPSLPDVIVTPAQDHAVLIALDFVLRRYSSLSITHVRFPPTDLPLCDWMGSLSLEEWRSK